MPAKHSAHAFGTARLVLSFAAAILVLLVVWIAVRAVGPAEASRLVVPPPPVSVKAAPVITSPAPPSPSATRSSAAARTSRPVPSETRRPTSKPPVSPSPSSSAPAARDVAATVSVGASWQEGYVATVRVTNEGDQPVAWKVSVTHADVDDLRLRGVWGADGDLSGSTLTCGGGMLAPGESVRFGYQTSVRAERGEARPADCNAVGGSCRMR